MVVSFNDRVVAERTVFILLFILTILILTSFPLITASGNETNLSVFRNESSNVTRRLLGSAYGMMGGIATPEPNVSSTQEPTTTPPPITTSTPTTTAPVPELISSKKLRIIVLANSIDYELAAEFFGFLGNKGMDVTHVDAAEFKDGGYKEEKFVVILGGPDAPEGIGEIVQNITSSEEQDAIRQKGSRKKYVKTNTWTSGQRVMVIAGSDRNETKNTEDENQDSVATDAKASS